nr:ATP-binding protein [uncultured Carboxylicivirga sp.]
MRRSLLLATLLVVSLLCITTQIFSQSNDDEYLFISYGEENGVNDPDILAFEQDSTGYFWIATNNGLYRYDGQYFDLFTHLSYDTLSLPDNKVTAIDYDTIDNTLWVGTFFGEISCLDLKTYKFDNKPPVRTMNNLNGNGLITSITRHNKDWMIFGAQGSGLTFYDIKNNTYVRPDSFVKKYNNIVQLLTLNDTTYIATDKGLCYAIKINDNGFKVNEVEELAGIMPITSIRSKSNKTITLTDQHSLYQFSLEDKSVRKIYQNSSLQKFTTHYADRDGNFWIGTNGGGVLQVSENGKLINHYRSEDEKEKHLKSDWINDIFISNHEPIVWIGSKGSLGYFNSEHYKFDHKYINSKYQSGGDRIYLLFKDSKGRYWYNSLTNTYVSDINGENYKPLTYGIDKKEFKDRIFEIFEEDGGTLWMASEIGLLKVDNHKDNADLIQFHDDNIKNASFNNLTSVKEVNDSILWLSSYRGLVKYNKVNGSYQIYPYSLIENEVDSLSTNKFCLINDSVILLGTDESELIKFNLITENYKRISTQRKFGSLIKSNYILDVVKDSLDQVWLATYGSGLLQYFPDNDSVAPASFNTNLNSDVYGILQGEDGFLWMSTSTKLIKFNPENKSVTSYGPTDGVQVKEFNECAYSKAKDGTMMFGGIGGFVEFNPSKLRYNLNKPKVAISSYKLSSKAYNDEGPGEISVEYNVPDTIKISTDEKKISFFATVFNYTQSSKNLAAWKLEGYDASWDTLAAFADKSYGRLPEGTYKLLLKGSNNDEVWSEDIDSVVLVVKPTFYKSRAFKILLIILGFFALYLIYYLRGRIHKQREKRLQYLVEQSTSKLKKTNDELEHSREEMLVQKAELERHRNYLEELVLERTADLELAREKAEESDRLKTAFLANLSHEIRTPMNSIIGFSSLLSTDMHSEKDRNEFIKLIQQSSESLLVLIDDIIDISRIESGQLHLVKKQFKIVELCDMVYKSIALNGAFSANTELKIDMSGIAEDAELFSDWERLKQVLFNLINNALKFTSSGHVKLCVCEKTRADVAKYPEMFDDFSYPESFFLFRVEDTGIGIKEEDYNTIFTPFVKIEDRKINYSGMGLGLSIVKQIIHVLGGEIWLRSELGKGSTFYFYLPNQKLK